MARFVISLIGIAILSVSSIADEISDRISINGYSSFEFEARLGDEGRGDPNGSFDADLFDLVLNIQATDRLRIAADITWEHGTATEDKRGNVGVEYAFSEYTIKNSIRIRAGKMFVPFGIYNEIHTAKPAYLTVKEPLSTNKNHKFGSELRFYPRWANGISVLGNVTVRSRPLDYIAQISNGEQEITNPYEEDDNRQKGFAGRLRCVLTPGFRVGGSVYTDRLTELDSDDEPTGSFTTLLSVGGQLEYNRGDLGLEVEYIYGSLSPEHEDRLTRSGYAVLISYVLGNRFTPYVRFESLDPNHDLDDDNARMYIYGINIQIDDGMHFKTDLSTVHSEKGNSQFGDIAFTELKSALAVGF